MREGLYALLGLAVGIILSIIICRVIYKRLYVGCIHMDSSDPEVMPYLFLDLHREPETLASKSFVICKVDPVDITKQAGITQDSQRL